MRRILTIDDDTNTTDWMRVILRASKIKCHLTSVTNGRQAFRLLNSQPFDLCILEYALPDMTGVQFCTLMRQMGCRVPMMFFSAMNRTVDREKAAAAGANAYLAKPEDLAIFSETVARLLNGANPGVFSPRAVPLAQAA
ncbi:MAG: response regulator [Acidobacteria bacterium]|nr:response regulator [Acidobacteriota bacterium]